MRKETSEKLLDFCKKFPAYVKLCKVSILCCNFVVKNCDTCDESGYDRANGIQNDRLDLTINELSWWTIGSGRYRSIKLTRLPPGMNISSSRIPDFFRKSEFWPKVWFLPFFEDHVDSYCFFRFFFVRRFLMPQLFCLLSWGVSLKSFFEPQ